MGRRAADATLAERPEDYLMANTGLPFEIPFALPSDTVRSWPSLSEDIANAVNDAMFPLESTKTANYTLTVTDTNRVIGVNSSSSVTITVPTNAAQPFPLGSIVNVYRAGTGPVVIAGAGGVTVRNAGAIADQFVEVSLRKRGTNEWVLAGRVV